MHIQSNDPHPTRSRIATALVALFAVLCTCGIAGLFAAPANAGPLGDLIRDTTGIRIPGPRDLPGPLRPPEPPPCVRDPGRCVIEHGSDFPDVFVSQLNFFGCDASLAHLPGALAREIERAKRQASRSSYPIPEYIVRDLARFYPLQLLRSIRFSTDWGAAQNGTVHQVLLGNGFADAVTLDNVIVFRNPSLTNMRWLVAHEIAHVEQYAGMGIGGFSCSYVRDSGRLEGQANRKADYVMRFPVF